MQSSCPPDIAAQIERAAMNYSNGKREAKGWLAVLCPCGHAHDKPGAHAWLSPQSNFIFCHGKHGDIHWRDICNAWGIAIPQGSHRRPADPPLARLERPTNSQANEQVYYNPAWRDYLQLHRPALDFLEGRGINRYWALQYRLGYTSHDERLPQWAWEKISIPWIANGQVVGLKLRCVGKAPAGKGSYVSLSHSNFGGLYNFTFPDEMTVWGDVAPYHIILETELDAISLAIALGYPHGVLATPAGSITADKLLFTLGKPLYACPDNDAAGRAMLAKIKRIRPDCQILTIPDGYKDYGDYRKTGLPLWPNLSSVGV